MVPTTYELDEFGEAIRVYHYCSPECQGLDRHTFEDENIPYSEIDEPDTAWRDMESGECCAYCGNELIEPEN